MGHQEPSLLGFANRVDIVARQRRVFHAEGLHAPRMLVDTLYAATQLTKPDIAPQVLTHRPDIIDVESCRVARGYDIRNMSVLNMYQTALISTKPHRAVACR